MSSCSQLLDRPHSHEHLVQLYGDDHESLARNVSRFLSEGWRNGEGLLVVATASHRELLTKQLRGDGVDPVEAVREGRLVWLGAEAVLAGILVDDQLSPARFEQLIGGALRALMAHPGTPGVRAFGELVGLLWRAGRSTVAVQLEELWCGLLAAEPLQLFCAYPIDVLGSEFEEGTVGALLDAHTGLVSSIPDLDRALHQAMTDVLGPAPHQLTAALESRLERSGTAIPPGEAAVLSLRRTADASIPRILHRARRHARATVRRRRSSQTDGLTTSVAAEVLGTTPRTLMFYEEQGLIRPRRTTRGSRLYSAFDLSRAAMAMRLSRLGFPLRLIKQLASIRPEARTGSEASAKLTALLESMQLVTEGRVAELQSLTREIASALTSLRQCATCPRPPTREGCPECPCEANGARSGILQLALDIDPTHRSALDTSPIEGDI